jgi:hypothetical protein
MNRRFWMEAGALPPDATMLPGVKAAPDKMRRHLREYEEPVGVPLNAAAVFGIPLPVFAPGNTGADRADAVIAGPLMTDRARARIIQPQREALAALLEHKRYLYAPRGSGKTLVGLAWLLAAARTVSGYSAVRVFICPARARLQVAEEVALWTTLKPVILKGEKSRDLDGSDGVVYITAWETLIHWGPSITALPRYVAVMDELHTAKSPDRGTMRISPDGEKIWEEKDNVTVIAAKVGEQADAVIGLSGSPVPNRRIDLWAQLDCLERWCWGGKRDFGMRYCDGTFNGYGYEYKGKSEDAEFRARLRVVMHTVPQSAVRAFYPAKRRQVIKLEQSDLCPSPPGMAAEIRRAAKAAKGRTEALVGEYFEKLLEETAARKKDWIVRQVIEDMRAGSKVTVFTGRRSDADALGEAIESKAKVAGLLKDGVKRIWWSHGGVSNEARNAIRLEYMAYTGAIGCVNVGTGQAWGESLNLHDTDIAYFVMLPPTPKDVQQWEDRFCRMGGTKPVVICYVTVPSSIEDKQVDLLAFDKMPQVVATVGDEQMDEWLSEFRAAGADDMLAAIEKALATAKEKL